MSRHRRQRQRPDEPSSSEFPLSFFACPNPECADFNHFDAGNLSIAEHMGKGKAIRRLYCKSCGHRFSEREGSLMADAKLPLPAVVRIVKCLCHGCSIEATADICEVDPRTVERLLEKGGRRAEDFHRLQVDKLQQPLEAVEMDELHTRVQGQDPSRPRKKGVHRLLDRVGRWAGRGCTSSWSR